MGGGGALARGAPLSDRREYEPYVQRTTPRADTAIHVAEAGPDDVAQAAALSLTVAHGPLEVWRARLARDVAEQGRALIVARSDGEVLGYVRVGLVAPGPDDTAPEGWYLTGLVVAVRWRRRGVGEALVEAACAHAALHADVVWSTYDSENLTSAALHAARGFRVVRRGHVGFPGQPPGSRWELVRRDLPL